MDLWPIPLIFLMYIMYSERVVDSPKKWPIPLIIDYGSPERKYPSLRGRKFNPTPKFVGTKWSIFVKIYYTNTI